MHLQNTEFLAAACILGVTLQQFVYNMKDAHRHLHKNKSFTKPCTLNNRITLKLFCSFP